MVTMKKFNKYFGSVTTFPDRYNIDSPLSDAIQPIGNEQCVIYSVDDVCQDKLGFDIDINDLYGKVPHANNGGTNPKEVIQYILDNGVKWQQSGLTSKPFLSSFSAHVGSADAFDNVRRSIISEKISIMAWGTWDYLWGTSSVMIPATHSYSNHCVSIKGWDIINEETMLIVEAHLGRFLYMSRAVFNTWASTGYFGTAVLSDKAIVKYWEKLLALCTQIYSLLKNETMLFDTPKHAYHSVRVMADNAGFTLAQKNDLCGTIFQESGFIITATGKPNSDGSVDHGICQFNDNPKMGWIGTGCLFSSVQDCIDNPERAVAEMIQCFKDGHQNWWMGYAVRAKWLEANSPMWLLGIPNS